MRRQIVWIDCLQRPKLLNRVVCSMLLIVGDPQLTAGIAAFRIGSYALWPFGRSIVRRPSAGLGSLIGNILWIILLGWWLALGHLTSGILLCLTIIGIPLGLANFKLIPVSLTPLGREIVSTTDRDFA